MNISHTVIPASSKLSSVTRFLSKAVRLLLLLGVFFASTSCTVRMVSTPFLGTHIVPGINPAFNPAFNVGCPPQNFMPQQWGGFQGGFQGGVPVGFTGAGLRVPVMHPGYFQNYQSQVGPYSPPYGVNSDGGRQFPYPYYPYPRRTP